MGGGWTIITLIDIQPQGFIVCDPPSGNEVPDQNNTGDLWGELSSHELSLALHRISHVTNKRLVRLVLY